jgi:fermentation-respiration switch protein FrsA (DUF1100 family)
MRVLYLHGLHSRPGGVKPTFLRQSGFEVSNPYLPDEDFETSVVRAAECLRALRPHAVVGSSRGGAIALALGAEAAAVPLVLIAPAWKRWGDPSVVAPPHTLVLHSAGDEVIPFADSLDLVRRSQLPDRRLWIVGRDHNMTDPEALGSLAQAIREAAALGPRVD